MGQETFDHIDGYIEHLDGRAKVVDDKALQDLVLRTRKAGAWIVPTMVVWETLQGPVTLESRTGLPELQYLPADTGRSSGPRRSRRRLKNPQFNAAAGEAAHRQPDAHPEGAARRRRRLLLGSDAPQQFNVPGFSIHREMKSMADAGISALRDRQVRERPTSASTSRRRTRSGRRRRPAGGPDPRRRQSAAERDQHGEAIRA